MFLKNYGTGKIQGLILAVLLAFTLAGCGGAAKKKQYVKTTKTYLVCSECGEKYEVTQKEFHEMDYKNAEQDEDGGYILSCLKCDKVAAKIVTEEDHGE